MGIPAVVRCTATVVIGFFKARKRRSFSHSKCVKYTRQCRHWVWFVCSATQCTQRTCYVWSVAVGDSDSKNGGLLSLNSFLPLNKDFYRLVYVVNRVIRLSISSSKLKLEPSVARPYFGCSFSTSTTTDTSPLTSCTASKAVSFRPTHCTGPGDRSVVGANSSSGVQLIDYLIICAGLGARIWGVCSGEGE